MPEKNNQKRDKTRNEGIDAGGNCHAILFDVNSLLFIVYCFERSTIMIIVLLYCNYGKQRSVHNLYELGETE